MNRKLALFLISAVPVAIFAQTPDWVKNLGNCDRYPQAFYLTGFGIAKLGPDKDRSKCIQLAADQARSNVAQSIHVQIQSTITSQAEERNQDISQYFSASTQSRSSLQIQGLALENYFDDKEKTAYCLAYVRRDQLRQVYSEKAAALNREIRASQQRGLQAETGGDYIKALEAYLNCYPMFDQMAEAQMILAATQSNADQIFSELKDAVTPAQVTIADIREAVTRLLKRPISNIDDLAWYLAYCLKEQLPEEITAIQVVPFVYQDSEMGSSFARYFKQILENKLVEVNRWRLATQVAGLKESARGIAINYATSPQTGYILTGSYWHQGESVKVFAAVRQVSVDKIVASVDVLVPQTILVSSGLDLKPQNFSQAALDQRIFSEGELINGGLQLEAWTDKGSESILYSRGEQMRVYIRVNVPCYLRFVYHLADGTRTLLMDSHYIDDSKVNKIYEIPEKFECDEPFGAETLQIFASSQPFERVNTTERGGYIILADDLRSFVTGTRGMKKAQSRTSLKAEQRIVITTMIQ